MVPFIILPTSMRYNNFYGGKFLSSGLPPAYSYISEVPGDWADYNQWSWAEGKYQENPRFVNPDNGDYRLSSDSFCIDEGKPSDSYDNEPSSGGGRINLGYYGNTSSAELVRCCCGHKFIGCAKWRAD